MNRILLRNIPALCGTISIALGVTNTFAALDASQAALLRDATTHMKQLQTNLKLAQDSAGPPGQPVPVSRSRLALTRLAAAKDSATQVQARLEKLPADEADVKTLRGQYDAALADITALETRINAPATPTTPAPPAPARGQPTAPAAPATGTKLDYRQEQALKDAQFFLGEEGRAEAVAVVAAQAAKAQDKQSLDHRAINDAMASIGTADTRVTSINNRLATLPPQGAGVPELTATLKTQVESLQGSTAILKPVQEMFAKALAPATYPDFDADVKRLGELAQMFNNPQILQSNLARAALIWAQAPAASDEAARTVKKYALLIAQKTDHGVRVDSGGKYFTAKFDEFSTAAKKTGAALPGDIDANLAKIDAMIKEAVEQKKPAFFPGGITDQMGHVKEKLALLAVLAPDQSKAYAEKFAKAADRIKAAQAALSESIIQSNELPPDRYRAADREAIVQLATAAWKKEDPAAVVLAVRIPSQDWRREEYWRFQSGSWYKVDHSMLQAQVLVKRDDTLAEIRPINFTKDHMQNDSIGGYPLFPKAEPLGPNNLMLRSKVK